MCSIPIIPPDLCHEEILIQAAQSLDCLQEVINSVFEKFNHRIEINSAKFQEINVRIENAQKKIKEHLGTTKSIKIFSPARFPSTNIFSDISLTFPKKATESSLNEKNNVTENDYDIKNLLYETDLPNEKLIFFDLPIMATGSSYRSVAMDKAQVMREQNMGLSNVSKNVRSINSALLFDTDQPVHNFLGVKVKNSWKRSKSYTNQCPKQTGENTKLSIVKQLLEPPPPSLANRRHKVTPASGLRYMPKLNEAPDLHLPEDLPDLPGVADDIYFEFNDSQQIAPSLFIDNLPDVPEIEEGIDKVGTVFILDPNSLAIKILKIPEGNEEKTSKEILQKSNVKLIETSHVPPPPPPPPPPPVILDKPSNDIETNIKKKNDNSNSFKISASEDSRSQLMDAIRQAGGANGLRSRSKSNTNTTETAKISATNIKTSNKGGDLMADLHNKLLMRRKGISGAKELTESTITPIKSTSNNPVLSRLSSLIPPPLPPKISDDDDDNENDAGDWTD